MKHVEELKQAIRKLHGAEAIHITTVPVGETREGNIIEGLVQVFDLRAHFQAKWAYAWMDETDNPDKPRSVCDGASYLSGDFTRDGGKERNRAGLGGCFAGKIMEPSDRLFKFLSRNEGLSRLFTLTGVGVEKVT
jgi:hypothetical protein